MEAYLPFLFMALSALALLAGISFLWGSLRVLFGGDHELYLEQSGAVRRRMELLDEKTAVLKSLQDLEFEREVGKLSEQDFARLAAEFRTRAKRIMRTLDDDLREHRDKASKLVAEELKQVAVDARAAAREPAVDAREPAVDAREPAVDAREPVVDAQGKERAP